MLFTKDVKIIKDDEKKTYTSFVFDRPNFEHPDNAATKQHKPKVDGKPTLLEDGSEFIGSKPANEVSKGLSTKQIDELYSDMLAYVAPIMLRDRKDKKGNVVVSPYKVYSNVEDAAKLFCLACCSDAITAYVRLQLDADNRPQTIDLAAVRYAQVKLFIKDAKAKGKEMTEEQGYDKLARSQARDLVEEAEEASEELSMADALLQLDWYQERLKAAPVPATV